MRFSGLTLFRHTSETGNLITRSQRGPGTHVPKEGRSFDFLSTKPHDDALVAAQLSALKVPYIQVGGNVSPNKENAFMTAVYPIMAQLNLLA